MAGNLILILFPCVMCCDLIQIRSATRVTYVERSTSTTAASRSTESCTLSTVSFFMFASIRAECRSADARMRRSSDFELYICLIVWLDERLFIRPELFLDSLVWDVLHRFTFFTHYFINAHKDRDVMMHHDLTQESIHSWFESGFVFKRHIRLKNCIYLRSQIQYFIVFILNEINKLINQSPSWLVNFFIISCQHNDI